MLDRLNIERLTIFLGGLCCREPRALALAIGPVTEAPRSGPGGPDVDLILAEGQRCLVTVQPRTASGRPARIDGAPTFVSDGPAVVVVPTADPRAAFLVAGPLGDAPNATANVTVSADADLGEGVETIANVVQVTVLPPHAATLDLGLGTVEDVPADALATA